MRTLLIVLALMIVPVALSGCNTVEGMGKDIEHAGESIQKL